MLQRYFVANANPTFLKRLGLTESEAIAFYVRRRLLARVITLMRLTTPMERNMLPQDRFWIRACRYWMRPTQTIQEQADAIIEEEINEAVDAAVELALKKH